MNLYQYCLNNPVNFVDPWGLHTITVYIKKAGPWGQRGSKGGWGNAWVEIADDNGNKINRGSWPTGLKDDTKLNKKANISKTIDITEQQYERVKKGFENYGNKNWRKISENCVDFVYHAVEDWAEQGLPGSDWGLDTPNDLAEDLKGDKGKCEKEN